MLLLNWKWFRALGQSVRMEEGCFSYGLNLNPEDKYVLNMSAIVQNKNLTEN